MDRASLMFRQVYVLQNEDEEDRGDRDKRKIGIVKLGVSNGIINFVFGVIILSCIYIYTCPRDGYCMLALYMMCVHVCHLITEPVEKRRYCRNCLQRERRRKRSVERSRRKVTVFYSGLVASLISSLSFFSMMNE